MRRITIPILALVLIFNLFAGTSSVSASTTSTKETSALKGASQPQITYSIPATVVEGNDFAVTVNIQNVTDLYGVSLSLKFNPQIIKVSSITSGGIFAPKKMLLTEPVNKYDNTSGTLDYCALLISNVTGMDGSGALLTINFKAVSSGNINFSTTFNPDEVLTLNGNNTQILLSNSAALAIPYTFTNASKSILQPDYVHKRIAGQERYDTAAEISREGWFNSDTVIVTYGDNFPDALVSIPFAGLKDAPILLTGYGSLHPAAYNEIVRLKAKKVYIFGGPNVVSTAVETTLKGLVGSSNVTRIYGQTRFDTSLAIAKEYVALAASMNKTIDTAVVTTGYNYPDALAISPFAAKYNMPIIFSDVDGIPADSVKFLKDSGIKKVIIAGGPYMVSTATDKQLTSLGITVQRLYGQTRYDTSMAIVKNFDNGSFTGMLVATGEDFPDALTGGVFAVKKNSPLILVDGISLTADQKSFLSRPAVKYKYILGGIFRISPELEKIIFGS